MMRQKQRRKKKKTFKWLFIKRSAKEGRTTHAAFEAWRNLTLQKMMWKNS